MFTQLQLSPVMSVEDCRRLRGGGAMLVRRRKDGRCCRVVVGMGGVGGRGGNVGIRRSRREVGREEHQE